MGRLDSTRADAVAQRLRDPDETLPLNNTNLLREIDETQYADLRRTGGRLQLLDIRERVDFSQHHLPDAINLPFDELPRAEFELSRKTVTVIDCGDEVRLRCHTAGAQLKAHGFQEVAVLIR